MKIKLYVLLVCLIFCAGTRAQQIIDAEYFINTDPGTGLASPITIIAGLSIDETIQIPVGSIGEGLHVLGVRVLDDDGLWSLFERRSFIVEYLNATDLVAAEFFIDSDPGIGNATPIVITSGTGVQQNLSIPIPNLSEGMHLLAIRVKNAAGKWSLFERKNFIVQYLITSDLVSAEYFIDSDPGVGNATPVNITAGSTVQQSLTLAIPNLSEGMHLLAIRVKNAAGKWSLYDRKNFIVQPLVFGDVIAAEFFIDADPGVGNGIPVDVTNGANVDEDLLLMIPNTTPVGDHNLALRVLDSKGKWSLYENNLFKVCPLMTTDPSHLDASCAESTDGSASVNPSGGMSPYTFIWSSGQTTSNISGLFPGVYHVTITGADDCETIEHITIGVIADLENPVITCPPNMSVSTEVGECSTVVNYNASASDNCAGTLISYSPASGTSFNVGTTTVTATATDAAGNESECTFTLTVSDDEDPVITCPSNLSVSADVGECNKAVSYSANASDNCPGTTISYSPASGSTFNVGTATVNVTATDASSNESECTFTVTVSDDEYPMVTCPSNISASADVGECSNAVSFSASASDNCEGVALSYSHASGSTFNVGTTTVAVMATDASGNESECTFAIIVSDDEDPVINCPSNISVSAELGECNAAVSFSASTDDNCSGGEIVYIPIENNDLEAGNDGFTTEYNFTTSNTTEGEYNVLINPQSWNGGFNACTDHTSGAGKMLVLNGHPIAGKKLWCQQVSTVIGSTYFFEFWSTSLLSGNASHLEVRVNGAPIGDLIEDDLCDWEMSSFSFIATNSVTEICIHELTGVLFPNDFAIDDITLYELVPNSVQVSYSHSSGSHFNVGTTSVVATAIDESGNESECTFTITVSDDQAPVITCPENISVSTAAGECSKEVNYSASISDNCEGVSSSYSPSSGGTFSVGTTTVSATASDANGNESECSFNVTVIDDESPVITCPSNISVSANLGECNKSVSFSASAIDNCDGATIEYSQASGSSFNVGTATVTATATDASGNVSECTFSIIVSDDEDPVITCPEPIVGTPDEGSCTKNVSYTASGSDNCEIAGLTYSPASGSSFIIGVTTVTVVATDIHGNVSSCTFTVTINAQTEICDNDIDDDCDGVIDDGCGGSDADGDGVDDEDDNCPAIANPNQDDNDCDGVGDVCDVCPGGDDTIDNNNDGQPDCHVYPGFSNLPSSWKCGNNNTKVYICHSGNNPNTLCASQSAVQSHLDHGDYLGPCDESNCGGNFRRKVSFEANTHFDNSKEFDLKHNEGLDLFVRPNPVSSRMVLEFSEHIERGILKIVDVYGRNIWIRQISSSTIRFIFESETLESWQAGGLYWIQYECDGILISKKFIVLK
jgi:hypothetical protein